MRGYRWSTMLALYLLCMLCVHGMLLPAQVFAAESDRMDIGTDGILTLHSQQAADAGVSSLQFTVLVNAGNSQSATVDFVQDGKLDAKVVESFWHADTGELNVYVAGNGGLFDNGQTYNLTLGRVTVTDSSGKEVAAELRIDKNSLYYVIGTELRQVEDLIVPAEPVVLNTTTAGSSGAGAGSTDTSGGVIWDNSGAAAGTGSTGVAGAGSGGNRSGGTGSPVTASDESGEPGEDDERNLHTRLLTVLHTAESLREEDYTGESYQALKAAIERAEALLNAPDASREDVEDAILELENAMGALVSVSDMPLTPVSTGTAPQEEVKSGSVQVVLVSIIVAVTVLGIGGVLFVQLKDNRKSL